MKLFVTGGTGLIGRALVPELLARGDEVVCVTRSGEKARAFLPAGVEVLTADPAVPGPWQQWVGSCDAVVNLAGEPLAGGRWTRGRKKRFRRSRVETTRNVAEAIALTDRVRVLVSASAVGYYGGGDDRALDEQCEPGHDFLGRLALVWEEAARAVEGRGRRVVLLRTGIVLAREGGALPRMMLPYRFGLGGPLGAGRHYFPWIHFRDVLRVVLFALEREDLAGPVNVVVPDPPTQAQFAAALGRALGKRASFRTPAWLLKFALGEMADLLLHGQRAVPKALRARGFTFEHERLERALGDLLA
jgi:uncharacterized protein (TIGR01777 family)